MTRNTNAPRTAKTTDIAKVEQLLRDAAFVLRLTRQVKADMLSDTARPSRPATQTSECTPAALGA